MTGHQKCEETLQRYMQRLSEEKDQTLKYITEVKKLNQVIKVKDQQISSLKNEVHQLSKKSSPQHLTNMSNPSLYASLAKSFIKTQNYLCGAKFTQSVIELCNSKIRCSQEKIEPMLQSTKLIQDIFIIKKPQLKYSCQQSKANFIYRLGHSPEIEEGLNTLLAEQLNRQVGKEPQEKVRMLMFNSPLTIMQSTFCQNRISTFVNSSHYYFGFFVHLHIKNEATSELEQYIFGVISYYPLFELFNKIIFHGSQILSGTPFSESNFEEVGKLGNIQVIPHKVIELQIMDTLITLNTNPPDLTSELFLNHKSLAKYLTWQLIIDILMLILLEQPLTLYSQDPNLLSRLIIFEIALIRPLKYPYPIVLNLPSSLSILLQSPFPTLLGSTKEDEILPFKEQRSIFDLDKKIAVSLSMILSNFKSARDYIKNNYRQIVKKQNFDFGSVMMKIINEGKQIEELKIFWKAISKTQMFRVYQLQSKLTVTDK